MTFTRSIKVVLGEKYATFSGRAGRAEFWWFVLFTMMVVLAVNLFGLAFLVDASGEVVPGGSLLWLLPVVALWLPGLAVQVRRLHDIGLSGWWVLLGFVPFASVALLVLMVLPSGPDNAYGPGSPSAGTIPAPGWYADPADIAQLRYWDGAGWTGHTTQPTFH